MHRRNIQDFPLQSPPSQIHALASYISSIDTQLFDLPRQMPNNPYCNNSKPSFYSMSKCAVTDISQHQGQQGEENEQQQEEFVMPISHQNGPAMILNNQMEFYGKQSIVDAQQLANVGFGEQMITQATFKPNQLKKYFDSQNQNKIRIKKLLQDKMLNPLKKHTIKEKENNKNIQNSAKDKKPTKYQKLLQEYFNKPKTAIIKKQTNSSDSQSLSKRRCQSVVREHSRKESGMNYIQALQKVNTKQIVRTLEPCNSNKNIKNSCALKNNQSQTLKSKALLQKTLSQSTLHQTHRNYLSVDRGRSWVKLSFEQRQNRTLQKRKSKQSEGRRENLQKQVEGCTFKPTLCQYKPLPKPLPVKTYAKLYLDKLRKRN